MLVGLRLILELADVDQQAVARLNRLASAITGRGLA